MSGFERKRKYRVDFILVLESPIKVYFFFLAQNGRPGLGALRVRADCSSQQQRTNNQVDLRAQDSVTLLVKDKKIKDR